LKGLATDALAAGLDVRMLRSLLVLLEECSVSKAATRLGLSQPAVSHALAKLRRVFGDPLLVNAHGRMIPTLRAVALRGEVADILASIDALVAKRGAFDPSTDTGSLVVTSSEIFEYLLLPALHARMQREAPNMRLQFMQPDRTQIERWLAQGRVDFRLAFLPDFGGTLHSRRLFEDRWVCVLRADHPRVRGRLTLEQYAALAHVSIDIVGSTTSEQMIDQALGQHGVQRRHVLRVQSALSVPRIIAASDSIATLPERFCRSFEALPLQFVRPPIELTPMVCGLYWHERTHRQPSHVWFRKLLAEVAAEVLPRRQRGA
jgi:DNA-binding transcriptional LysR family regulator